MVNKFISSINGMPLKDRISRERLDALEAVNADSRITVLENVKAGDRLSALESVNADSRITALENVKAGDRLSALETVNANSRITALEDVNADSRITVLEAVNAGDRLSALEAVNAGDRLSALEAVNTGDRLSALEAVNAGDRLSALELYNGKKVYEKYVDFGNLPNNSSNHIPLYISAATYPNFNVISYEYIVKYSNFQLLNPCKLAIDNPGYIFWGVANPNGNWHAYVKTNFDASAATAFGKVRYTID